MKDEEVIILAGIIIIEDEPIVDATPNVSTNLGYDKGQLVYIK